ncbi:MAG: carboxypeptidase-like regulatory domain-containing protein, partial [Segetibacter sp.]|nr:carboxypeptidase-like regulatory domain-containing protein [Segetibacter sp.]
MCKIYFLQRCLNLLAAIITCICFFIPPDAFAQQRINGTVRDAGTAKPLAGATISVKGGTASTVSDANGAFTIAVPDNNSVLTVSYVGYAQQEIQGNRANAEITLLSNSAELNQVVVVGYGTQNKRDVTGSVKSIKSEAFNRGIINSPQQLLQGKVAGVNVTSASG